MCRGFQQALGNTAENQRERERSSCNGAYVPAGETEERPEKYQLVPNVRENRKGNGTQCPGRTASNCEKGGREGFSEEGGI